MRMSQVSSNLTLILRVPKEYFLPNPNQIYIIKYLIYDYYLQIPIKRYLLNTNLVNMDFYCFFKITWS